MRTISVVAFLLIFTSCTRKISCCFVVDINVNIEVTDSSGNDLLDPDNPLSLNTDKLNVYSSIDGQVRTGINGTTVSPGFIIYRQANEDSTNRYVMSIYPNEDPSEDYPVTYIHWNNNDVDTLKCEFSRNEGGTVCEKVWYNEKLEYPDGNINSGRSFQVIK